MRRIIIETNEVDYIIKCANNSMYGTALIFIDRNEYDESLSKQVSKGEDSLIGAKLKKDFKY